MKTSRAQSLKQLRKTAERIRAANRTEGFNADEVRVGDLLGATQIVGLQRLARQHQTSVRQELALAVDAYLLGLSFEEAQMLMKLQRRLEVTAHRLNERKIFSRAPRELGLSRERLVADAVGRLSQDESAGLNTYAYVDNNPLTNIDPDGLTAIPLPIPVPPPPVPGNPSSPGAGGGTEDDGDATSGGRGRGRDGSRARPPGNISDAGSGSESRSIPMPEKPKCGCTCICRADANDNIPGNIKPGDRTFAFGEATASNCAEASKEAKRKATRALGKQPKHVGCRCAGS